MIHLEGRVSVLAALAARRRRVQVVLVKHDLAADKAKDILAAAEASGVPVRRASGPELSAMVHGASHGGVVAVCGLLPRLSQADLLDLVAGLSKPPLLLMLEGVDDARNLGFTLRTAHAVGVDAILIKKHLWDFDETEVARAASGALEHVPLVQFESIDLLQKLQKQGLVLYGCLAGVRRSVFRTRLTRPVILAIGGEKRGLSGAVRGICDQFITIPSLAEASSLSLSHASAIVLGEVLRQRVRGERMKAKRATDGASI